MCSAVFIRGGKTNMRGKVLSYEIKKRTFEGNFDESKNDSVLTSKYKPSHKYVAIYNVQWDHGGISEFKDTYRTKKIANVEMELKKLYGI